MEQLTTERLKACTRVEHQLRGIQRSMKRALAREDLRGAETCRQMILRLEGKRARLYGAAAQAGER